MALSYEKVRNNAHCSILNFVKVKKYFLHKYYCHVHKIKVFYSNSRRSRLKSNRQYQSFANIQ